MKIDVVLATYNGMAHLRPLLDSLMAQDFQDFRIIVRDDISTDGTPPLIWQYATAYPDKFFLVAPGERLGAAGNFASLLALTEAPYTATCDQDDVWHKDKLSRQLEVMYEMEARFSPDVPLLVHGEARVIDADGKRLHDSFARAQGLTPQKALLPRLLVQNHVLGCTMLMNRPLLSLAQPIHPAARMHDHWIALVAAACGHTAYITEPVLDYRQHSENTIGLKKRGLKSLKEKTRKTMEENALQAAALMEHTANLLPQLSDYQLSQFVKLQGLPHAARVGAMLAGGYWRSPWWQNAAVVAFR